MRGDFEPVVSEMYDRDMEEAVLAGAMSDLALINLFFEYVKPDLFSLKLHEEIAAAIIKIKGSGLTPDMLLVYQEIKGSLHLGVAGGPSYLAKMTTKYGYDEPRNYIAKINILKEYYIHRKAFEQTIETYTKLKENGRDKTREIYDSHMLNMVKIIDSLKVDESETIEMIANQVQKEVEMSAKGIKPEQGISTGLNVMDEAMYGWAKSDLILLAARPGMGKTSLMLTHVIASCEAGIPTDVYSLEMSKKQLITRMACQIASVDSTLLRLGRLNESHLQELVKALVKIKKYPLYIDDGVNINVNKVRSRSIRNKAKRGVGIIFIDYIQLMELSGKGTKNDDVGEISRGLKVLAKELNVPIIALSQLSRKVENRTGNRPVLADLRDSGTLEQDADMVIFVYRPEEYGMEYYSDDTSTREVAELIIAKFRGGSVGSVKTRFRKEFTQFSDWPTGGYVPGDNSRVKEDIPF